MAVHMVCSYAENGQIILTLDSFDRVELTKKECLGKTAQRIPLGGLVGIIDKSTGELKTDNLKFKPWGRKKFIAATMQQINKLREKPLTHRVRILPIGIVEVLKR